jgi:hypothetical protein
MPNKPMMKQNMTSSGPERRQHRESHGPARNWVLILIPVIGAGIVALLVIASQRERPNSTNDSVKAEPEQPAPEPTRARLAGPDPFPIVPGFVRVPSRPATITTTLPESESSAAARQLVTSLSEVSLRAGELTPEQAAKWHRNLEELIGQGTAAVPVLQEFFQRNEDVRFDAGAGTNLLGEATLRIAFLKVLFDIPAPQNVELQQQVLQTTVDPEEIALLARQLERQQPNRHRELIVEAASAVLERASNGELPAHDISLMVDLLKEYGVGPPRGN